MVGDVRVEAEVREILRVGCVECRICGGVVMPLEALEGHFRVVHPVEWFQAVEVLRRRGVLKGGDA